MAHAFGSVTQRWWEEQRSRHMCFAYVRYKGYVLCLWPYRSALALFLLLLFFQLYSWVLQSLSPADSLLAQFPSQPCLQQQEYTLPSNLQGGGPGASWLRVSSPASRASGVPGPVSFLRPDFCLWLLAGSHWALQASGQTWHTCLTWFLSEWTCHTSQQHLGSGRRFRSSGAWHWPVLELCRAEHHSSLPPLSGKQRNWTWSWYWNLASRAWGTSLY